MTPVFLGEPDQICSVMNLCLAWRFAFLFIFYFLPPHRLGRVPPWQSYICGWLIYLLCLVFQLSWWLMCFGYRTYSKSLGTGLMRLSSRQRMRWRKCVLEILPHAALCCVYPACPLQRQQHCSERESFTLSCICTVIPALRQMKHQLFPGPLKSDNEMGKRWNVDGFFWQNMWCEMRNTKEEKSLYFLCTYKLGIQDAEKHFVAHQF